MSIEKAVERIGWRLKENHWKHNENDIKAYNTIVEYVENAQKNLYDQHELFAKLYIHIYGQYLMKYGATPYARIPREVLTKEIAKSVHEHMIEFHRITNEVMQFKQIEGIKNPEDLKEFKTETFDYDFVEENMVSQINETIFKHQGWKN